MKAAATVGKASGLAHHAGRMPAVSPLAGRYEPGQVFTIVSTAALLETGRPVRGDPLHESAEGAIFQAG